MQVQAWMEFRYVIFVTDGRGISHYQSQLWSSSMSPYASLSVTNIFQCHSIWYYTQKHHKHAIELKEIVAYGLMLTSGNYLGDDNSKSVFVNDFFYDLIRISRKFFYTAPNPYYSKDLATNQYFNWYCEIYLFLELNVLKYISNIDF